MGKYAKLDLVKKRVDELLPHPINPRSHPDSQIELVKDWLAKLSYYKNIVVQTGTNYVLAGHSVLEALKQSDYEFVDVNEEDLPEEMALALMAWDNKSGELSFWDQVNLIVMEAELVKMDVQMASMGFGDGEIDSMGSNVVTEDDPPPVSEEEPVTQTGDLWLLGEHRVLCGDSTVEADVERVMDGEKADMVFTDPPYGVNYGAKNRFLNSFQPSGRNLSDIEGDDLDEDKLYTMLKTAFILCRENSEDDCSYYITAPQGGSLGLMMMMMRDSGLPIRHVLIWVKNQPGFSLNRLDYDYQHEPILYTWNKKHTFYGNGEHRSSTWQIDRPRAAKEHPTMKPLELVANALQNSSVSGQVVCDPFLGSGTTLIAADQLDRKCYGLEISPAYCDVIVQRYINHVGTDEDVYVERDGNRLSWEEAQMPERQKVHVC